MSITPLPSERPHSMSPPTDDPSTNPGFAWLALGAAVLTVAGSMWLSLGMGLLACPLCFYQRTFLFGTVAILLLGLFLGAGRTAVLSVLALTLTFAGLGVAVFHVYLEVTSKLECPMGLLELRSAPQQSLAAISIVTVLLLGDVISRRKTICCGAVAALGALILGGACTYGCIVGTPPPPQPKKAYEEPLKGCRVPYHEPK
jgi:disulfide bond formation protein DsbB